MKLQKCLMMLSLLASINAFAQAGNGAGNGGGVHYCPAAANGALVYETYDLWEAKNLLNHGQRLTIAPWDGVTTKEQYLERALAKISALDASTAKGVRRALALMNAKVQDSENLELEVIPDVKSLIRGRGCQYVQLANWVDGEALKIHGLSDEIVLRDQRIYELMDPLNRAAIDLHEAVYKMRRVSFGDDGSGSVRARQFVGRVFSTQALTMDLLVWVSRFGNVTYFEGKTSVLGEYAFLHTFADHECTEQEKAEATLTITNRSSGTVVASAWGMGNKVVIAAQQTVVLPLKAAEPSSSIALASNYTLDFKRNSSAKMDLSIEVNACGKRMTKEVSLESGTLFMTKIYKAPI